MKRKTLLVVAFLLMLYIGPMLLASSSGHMAIPAEMNMVKDFAPSTDYETSDQSITNFSETLPDDVLYYPDAFPNSTETSATSGDGDYTDAESLDAVLWTGSLEVANFTFSNTIEGFTYHCYGREDFATGESYLEYYNGSEWVTLETFTDSLAWYNDTHSAFGTVISLRINSDIDAVIEVDFLSVNVNYMTLADADHYAESFADVSDWTQSVGGTWGTDGDNMYVDVPKDAGYDIYYTNIPSITSIKNYYYEIRLRVNTSTSYTGNVVLKWHSGDGGGGTSGQTGNLQPSTTGNTYKGIIPTAIGLESIRLWFSVGVTSPGPIRFYVDYLRISPADEMGWQHDGSTTAGTIGIGSSTFVDSSDNDILTVNTTSVESVPYWNTYQILIDTTSTKAEIETTYYQFLEVRWRCTALTAGFVYLDMYADDYVAYALGGYHDSSFDWVIERFNMKAFTTGIVNQDGLCIMTYSDSIGEYSTVELDYVKAYSIANYTVTQTGTSTDDVFYVDSDILYCEATSITSIVLDHDPALSFDTNTIPSSTWTLTTASGTPQIDFYIDAAWSGYTSDTSGSFPSGTLTDIRIKFTASANIEAITFLSPIPQWYEAGEATLWFSVPMHPWGLNALLILLGMILVVLSGVYLVKGGRSEASMNKVFYALVMFMLGWGLVIGGILP